MIADNREDGEFCACDGGVSDGKFARTVYDGGKDMAWDIK